jgi:hypothetical protein
MYLFQGLHVGSPSFRSPSLKSEHPALTFSFLMIYFCTPETESSRQKSLRTRIHNTVVSELVIQQKLRQKICDSSVPGLINWQTLTNDFYSPPVTVSANM